MTRRAVETGRGPGGWNFGEIFPLGAHLDSFLRESDPLGLDPALLGWESLFS